MLPFVKSLLPMTLTTLDEYPANLDVSKMLSFVINLPLNISIFLHFLDGVYKTMGNKKMDNPALVIMPEV